MRRPTRQTVLGLLLAAVCAAAIACTPGGSGATAAPGGSNAAPSAGPPASPSSRGDY